MRANGLTLIEEDGPRHRRGDRGRRRRATLGPQDYVIVTLKAHSVPPAVPAILPLLGEETTIVSGVNGIPWWYFHGLDGPLDGDAPRLGRSRRRAVERLRAGAHARLRGLSGRRGDRARRDPARRGQPLLARRTRRARSPTRAVRLSEALSAAGLKAPVRPRIRDEIWVKLWGNLSFNPISALTLATLDVLCTDPGTRKRGPRHDARGAGDRRERSACKFPDRRRPPHRRRRRGRGAPDLDAAGPRGRPAAWRSTRSSARCRNWVG